MSTWGCLRKEKISKSYSFPSSNQVWPTIPPCFAISTRTRLANVAASSPGYKQKGKINFCVTETAGVFRLCGERRSLISYHLMHHGKIPDFADDRPRCHHLPNVSLHGWLVSPESIAKQRIIPNRYRINRTVELKTAFLEHQDRGVVHASTCNRKIRQVTIGQSINQSIVPTIEQSINQAINQSINRSRDETIHSTMKSPSTVLGSCTFWKY